MEATKATAHHPRPPPSTSDLMSSAKLIAEAAKSAASHDSAKIDKGRVAGAAADLVGAAKHYGKLEEKSFGKYLDKAEGYLHTYHTSSSSSSTATAASPTSSGGPSQSHHEDSHVSSGGKSGYGDYIKLAQGLLKKH